MSFNFKEKAYRKLIFHSAKYPECIVQGFLVGNDCDVEYAIPLSHNLLLSPMLSIASKMILTWINENHGEGKMEIIGMYSSSTCNGEIPILSQRAATGIIQQNPKASLIIIDTESLKKPELSGLKQFIFKNNKWINDESLYSVKVSKDVIKNVNSMVEAELHYEIVDFESHLENSALDFINN